MRLEISISSDYLNFKCGDCGNTLIPIFYGIDVGILAARLKFYCKACDEEVVYKAKTSPMLGPIEADLLDMEYNRTKFPYKLMNKNKIYSHLRKEGHTRFSSKGLE